MDEFAPLRDAAVPLPHPQHCPPWCADCQHDDLDPPYVALHRSPPAIVTLYDEGCDEIRAQVRAAFWDKAPDWIGTDPADLERPHVEVGFPDSGDVQLYLNPGQARTFAAALIRAADAADTEALYRPSAPPAMTSTAVPASTPSRQA
ncbi:hypothetical protein [Actinoplanes sp. TFC3]|uniref:DUF6907 domain-containing protein n=1 Tax=Actinoplanes sp. TFC3 TaxID=1710355 RepID=UPI0009E81FB1|nr:hypothetical protein [Actinoplanes sp. TFC3]